MLVSVRRLVLIVGLLCAALLSRAVADPDLSLITIRNANPGTKVTIEPHDKDGAILTIHNATEGNANSLGVIEFVLTHNEEAMTKAYRQ